MASYLSLPKGRTRDVFVAQGRIVARSGNCRRWDGANHMPIFGCGRGWQHKAFAEGFHAGSKEIGIPVVVDHASN